MKVVMKSILGIGLMVILLCGCEKEGVSTTKTEKTHMQTTMSSSFVTTTKTSHQDPTTTVEDKTTTKAEKSTIQQINPVTTISQTPAYTKKVVKKKVTTVYTKKTTVAVAEKSAVTEAVRKSTKAVKRTSATPTTTKPFDIDYWLKYAQNKALSLGYVLDERVNETWDTPIHCHAKCLYIERDINDLFSFYQKTEPDLTAFWIWYEEESPGVYNLYFGRG